MLVYLRDGDFVEFNAESYFETVMASIKRCCQKSFGASPYPVRQIVLTGQAESLIVVDPEGKPLRNAISWLDMRSREECEELKRAFDPQTCYETTGQPEIIPTWPITKILWMKRHERKIFDSVNNWVHSVTSS